MNDARQGMLFCAASALLTATAANAVLVSFKQVGGRRISCSESGLAGGLPSECAPNHDFYTDVFVGSITSVVPLGDRDVTLVVKPEEVFQGELGASVELVASHGLCFPDFIVGERWFFTLHRTAGEPLTLYFYSHDAVRIADAAVRLSALRRIPTLGQQGLLRGVVVKREPFFQGPRDLDMDFGELAVVGAHLAARGDNGFAFMAESDAHGRFEFPLLPPGSYRVSMNRLNGFKADDKTVYIGPKSCEQLAMTHLARASISGDDQ